MRTAIRKNVRWVAAILGLMAVSAVVGAYILNEQGLRFPFADEEPVRMTVVFDNAQAVTPGQGQAAQVAGVDIGKIASVELKDGAAIVGLDIEPKYVREGLIRRDASALLRPRTALKDMYVQIRPGSKEAPPAEEGFRIPQSVTMTDVDLDELLAEFEPRTRDYLTLLVNGTGRGLRTRGDELAEVLARFKPTMRDLARVSKAVAQERRALRSVITSFAGLNERLARRPEDLSELVTASEATFRAFAAEEDGLRETVAELPGTLRETRRTLTAVTPFANALGGATSALVPTMSAITEANEEIEPFARQALRPIRTQIRPFVREARPLVRNLAPAATDLGETLPELSRGGRALNRFFNMLGFNDGGAQGPDVPGRDEGFLFWLGWVSHQTPNLINVDDANGPMRPIFLTGTCGTLASFVNNEPGLEFAMGLSPILATLCGNPSTRSIGEKGTAVARQTVARKGGTR